MASLEFLIHVNLSNKAIQTPASYQISLISLSATHQEKMLVYYQENI